MWGPSVNAGRGWMYVTLHLMVRWRKCHFSYMYLFCRLSTWHATRRTTWCLFFTLIAWIWRSQSLVTGAAFSRDSWRERVCRLAYNRSVTEIQQFPRHSLCSTLFCYSVASVLFGSWYSHTNSWWKKKQTYSKLHYMFYEDMIEVNKLFVFFCFFLASFWFF